MPESHPNDIEQMDKSYVFGTWSYQSEVSPTHVVSADGATFTEAGGHELLDFSVS